MKVPIPLGNGFYQSSSLPISSQLCTNLYPNYPQSDALSPQTLLPTPGITLLDSTTSGEVNRGSIEFGGNPYFVNSFTLYRLDEATDGMGGFIYSSVALGTIPGTGRISIAKNNTQICIVVPGDTSYIYSVAGGLVTITDADFDGPADAVVYIDGYFVFTNGNKFFSSNLNDGTAYDALDFASAEVDPDNIVAPFVHKNQLFIFGTETTEVFENVGGTGFPFQRIEGFIIDKGLYSQFAIVETEDTLIFMGGGTNEQAAIWKLQGATPLKISTTAIDNIIQKSTAAELSTAFALTYAQNGAYFASFTFKDDTFVYDSIASGFAQRPIWHKRESELGSNTVPWRVNDIVRAFGRLITFDSYDEAVGALEPEIYQEYSTNINRTWSSSPIAAGGDPLFPESLEVTVQSGASPQGDVGQLVMSISKDGGFTYGVQSQRSIGKIGETGKRLIWDRLGRYARYFNIKLTYSHNSKLVLIMANLLFPDE